MSNPRERVLSFTPIETLPLPRPLQRFGSAFPKALAATFATAYAPERGLVLDPLAFPWSAADAAEHVGRRGIARSREPLGAWARDVVRMAPAADELGESVTMLYTPRNVTALMATLRAIETAVVGMPEAQAVLKLCLLECIVSGSRLNAVAGHGTPLRIEKGRARRGHAAQTRETNIWLEYERTVKELIGWLVQRGATKNVARHDAGEADLVLCQAPVDDPLGGWSTVGSVLLLGAKTTRPLEAGEGRLASRERLLRQMRAALIEGHKASKPGAAAVVYVPHADATTLAATVLAATGAGYRLRTILYQRDALAGAYGNGAAAATCDFDREMPLLRDQSTTDGAAIEEAIREGVRDAYHERGEPVREDFAAAAAL